MHALSACRNATGRRDGWFPPPDDGSQTIETSFRRCIMSAKKTSTAPKVKKSKAAKEARSEDGKQAEAGAAKAAEPKGEEAKAPAKKAKKTKAEPKPRKLSAIDA